MELREIRNLRTYFQTPHGMSKTVDGVSLSIFSGRVPGRVAESGCGKSVLALSILQLLPRPPAVFAGGEILFDGRPLLEASNEEIRRLCGKRISMILQEPMTALNPVFTKASRAIGTPHRTDHCSSYPVQCDVSAPGVGHFTGGQHHPLGKRLVLSQYGRAAANAQQTSDHHAEGARSGPAEEEGK